MKQKMDPALLLKAYLPPVLWAAVIFVLSSQQVLPGLSVSFYDFVFKKSAHMFVYAVLYWLFWRGVDMSFAPENKKVRLYLPFLIVVVYAISDEFHQSLIPSRYATLRDVGYDILGMTIVLLRKYKYI